MIDKQNYLWSTIRRFDLAPNQMYLLYCIEAKQEIHKETDATKKLLNYLYEKGFISIAGVEVSLTPNGQEALAAIEEICKAPTKNILGEGYKMNIIKYRDMFPSKGVRSLSGDIRHLKDNERDLETNFKWFFKSYKYTWEEIINATKQYLSEQATNDYAYCKQSKYLIKKNNESMLATLIEVYKNNNIANQVYKPVVTRLI